MENPVAETGETVAVAAEPEAVVQEQPQAEHTPEMVPVTALQAERRERQQLQEQMKMLQDHVSLMQANQTTQQAAPQQDEMNGLSDDDVLTVGEAKRFMDRIQQNYQTSVEELRVQQKYSDYNEVVTKYLPEVVQKNPALKNTLQNDPNRYELAYYLAKNSDSYRGATHEAKKSTEAQRIIDNGQRAGNLSAVGSTSPQSAVSNIKNMSDEDFRKFANKNLGHF